MATRRASGTGGKIRRRKDGRYTTEVSLGRRGDGTRIRVSVYGRTADEVRTKRADLLRRAAQGTYVPPDKLTVGEFLEDWLRDVVAGLAPTTRRGYRSVVRKWAIPAFGHVRLQQLTPLHVQRLYGQALEAGISPNRVRVMHQVLHAAFAYAEDVLDLPRNPTQRTRRPRGAAVQRRPLSLVEANRVLAAAEGDRLEALWWLLLTTGARISELLHLKWTDIDLGTRTLQIRSGKTLAAARFVPIAPEAAAALASRRRTQRAEVEYVFTRPRGKRPLDYDPMLAAWYALLDRAQVDRRAPHACRHTAATRWRDLGVPLEIVKELLGHTQISITADVYTHTSPELQREAVQRLAAALKQPLAVEMAAALKQPLAVEMAVTPDPNAAADGAAAHG
ncbi:MAG TPA: site-specific integrase [Chloroflexota bacterium]|nr:site-specific integrase [Chloroflexota bacterium]